MQRFILVAAVVFLALAPARAKARAATRPNILWISAEDLSPDLGCYGDEYAATPNLDRFASQGALFTRAFTSAPVCAPSRSSIITGMYASSVGSQHMRSAVIPPTYVKCFSEYLRAAGYYCTNNVKTDYNFKHPTSAWDENSRNAHWRNRDKDQPFFAVFNFTETHESSANLHDKRANLTLELPVELRHDPAKAKLPAYYPDTPRVRETWAHWHDCITVMDQRVGALLKELEGDGLADNTIVIFWGDHGRGMPRGKRWLYDSGLRVPLIVRWPGKLEAGSIREDLVNLMDLAPTMLALAGVQVPAHMQGRVFLGEHQQPAPKYVFATRDRMDETYDMMRTVRDERYRYIYNFQPQKPYAQWLSYNEKSPIMQEWRRMKEAGDLKGPQALFFAKTKPVEELYDTQEDPDNVRNLAGAPEHQQRIAQMRNAMIEWMTRIDDKGFIPEPAGSPTTQPTRELPRVLPPIATSKNGKVELTCPTAGASIVYRVERDTWKLYSEPLQLTSGQSIRVRACRAGFEDSEEIRVGE